MVEARQYDSMGPFPLNWGQPLKEVISYTVPEDGKYHIVFQAQFVNDTNYVMSLKKLKGFTVMVTAKLFVNNSRVLGWTENIPVLRHYACPILVKVLDLKKGDVVSVKARGDCSHEYPKKSVFILTIDDTYHLDVTKL